MKTILKKLSIATLGTVLPAAIFAAPEAPEPPSGGKIFEVIEGRDRQIYFESNAPLEDIKGQSNAVSGHAVVDGNGAVIGGEWWVPVASLKTGIALRDEHLHGGDWLDAENFPHIKVRLIEVASWKEVATSDSFTKYEADFRGEVDIHGQTQPIRATATVIVLPESERTKKIAAGDLMALQAGFSVALADFGISHPVIGEKVANQVDIDVSLYHSSN